MVSKLSSGRMLVLFIFSGIFFSTGGLLLGKSFFTYGIVLFVLGIACIGVLWKLYHQTNRSITFFFDAVRNNDSTLVFPISNNNRSLDNLFRSLNNLNQHIQKIKLETEFREKYYKAIIKQSTTGFIVMAKNKNIELINEAACTLAGVSTDSSNLNLLKIKNSRLYETLCTMKAGGNLTYKGYNQFAVQQLLLKATEIKTEKIELMLFSVHNIRNELNEKELESYQKLISILTHEMMNSLAPLTSISKTLYNLFYSEGKVISPENLSEIQIITTLQGLKAIEEQSGGLTSFVNSYRKLIKIHQPKIHDIDVKEWADQLSVFYKDTCQTKNIEFEIQVHERLHSISGDKNLLNQVLFNLVNNAIDALEDIKNEKKIKISFSLAKGSTFIQVGNNGPAIPQSIQDKIFVPFYTTKEKGSGIGLSISSQIVKLHKGTLDVFSDETTGTIFTINF